MRPKYKCMDCHKEFKASEYYMAQEHYWRIHDEMITREDLCLKFYINGEDTRI